MLIRRAPLRLIVAAFLAGGAAGGLSAWTVGPAPPSGGLASAPADDFASLKASFRRPDTVPFPSNNRYTAAKRALGEMLFYDPRLSADASLSCASCHDRRKGFADGQARAAGTLGRALARHTPTLWNLAWSAHVFWDGRAHSLEEQVAGPIVAPDEMGQPLVALIERLRADPATRTAFAQAFPEKPVIDDENLAQALATYERTLVSPPTRFDRWIDGDDKALAPSEIAGFRLFTGKAGCANCHSGFAFTDYAFHDIGLPGDDRGRGAVLRLEAAEHAFKTAGLRELGRSAPYMHDGSLATLEDVLRHYETGIVDRSTLSKDLPRALTLSDGERADLIAFLGTLTSETDPQPPSAIVAAAAQPIPAATRVSTVSQHDKKFSPGHVAIKPGERLWVLNNDTRTHNVRVFDPAMEFDSGAQEPGETVEISFPVAGSFLLFCGIHPKMELQVEVAP
jgi:cytochrome c peroxidase